MGTIKVDFIKTEYHFLKPATKTRILFDENYDVSMLPQKGSLIVIGDKTYSVEQLVYFPFEDKERYVIHYMVMEKLTGKWFIGYTHGLIKGKLIIKFHGDLLTCAYETLCWLAENNYIGGNK